MDESTWGRNHRNGRYRALRNCQKGRHEQDRDGLPIRLRGVLVPFRHISALAVLQFD